MKEKNTKGKKEGNWKKWIGRFSIILFACFLCAVMQVFILYASGQTLLDSNALLWMLVLFLGYSACNTAISCFISGFQEEDAIEREHDFERKLEKYNEMRFHYRKKEGVAVIECSKEGETEEYNFSASYND